MRTPPPAPPTIKDPAVVQYLQLLNLFYLRELQALVDRNTAVAYIHLQSPAGKVFQVTVDDAGVLTTTLMRE